MSRKNNSGKKSNLSQFGLLDIPDFDDGDEQLNLSDDDFDLEAELAAISGGGGGRQRPKKPAPAPAANLDAMIAASLKDIPSDDEGSGDDDDPDLLNELKELAIEDDEAPAPPPRTSRPAPPPPGSAASSLISLLQDRITNYTAAEKSAKESGESSRARRFGRGLRTLNDLLKQAKTGRPVREEDIPPPVSLGKPGAEQTSPSAPPAEPPQETPAEPPLELPSEPPEPPAPQPELPPPPPPRVESQGLSEERQQGLQIILKRKEEFKAAALSCKHAGDKALALEHLKVVKQFDLVVEAYKAGEEMDLSELPTPEAIAAGFKSQQRVEAAAQSSTDNPPEPAPEATPEPAGLIMASTLEEALQQRLAAFEELAARAKEQGNAAKARRLGRVAQQYRDAGRALAAGKAPPLDELPAPPGYGPLPAQGSGPAASAPAPGPSTPAPPRRSAAPPAAPSPASPSAPSAAPRGRYERQLALLMHKQKEFKEAALTAKRKGDMDLAKECLRAAKGFEPLLEAARGGLLVDLDSLPRPPSARRLEGNTFDVISKEECDPDVEPATGGDVAALLQRRLAEQLRRCHSLRDRCHAIGHVAEAERFDQLAASVKRDLEVVLIAKSIGQNHPKFHYENREFAVLQVNPDLNENELELKIVRGIAYNVPNPNDIDTYVKFEFPYPPEAPESGRTETVKDTNNPRYEAVFKLPIQRSARNCLRVFKRHALKFELYSRGGWFSRDSLLATASVKLAPLEETVTLHEALPLMEGRRPAGGSIEVQLRVRTPLLRQQMSRESLRWLVIDG
ncbi:unnamed protein product, partial [Iphiclides podalirius]